MAKKTEEVAEEAVVAEGISEIVADFGRTDLNELASKLNEVIRKING